MEDRLYSPYEYIAKVWNDLTNKEDVYYGVCFAKTYPKAMKKIYKQYGEYITEITIAANEDSTVYEFNDDSGVLFNPENVKKR